MWPWQNIHFLFKKKKKTRQISSEKQPKNASRFYTPKYVRQESSTLDIKAWQPKLRLKDTVGIYSRDQKYHRSY